METKLSLPAVEIAERSDPGRDPEKQVNEDACGRAETPFGHLCVLCDGMGGHQNGREAATLAVKTVLDAFAVAGPAVDDVSGARARTLLEEAIVAANKAVFEMGEGTRHGRPGSTVVALLLHAGGAELAHVGDSRCYMIHGTQIFQITKDHSMVQKLVDAQVLTPAQAAAHPDANQILRALGSAETVDVEVRSQTIPHVAGDTFVLCSDGLSDLVDSSDIFQIASSAPPAQAVGQLVDLANARGGHDNVTVMVLRAREGAGGLREALAPTVPQTLVAVPVFDPAKPPSSPAAAGSTGGQVASTGAAASSSQQAVVQQAVVAPGVTQPLVTPPLITPPPQGQGIRLPVDVRPPRRVRRGVSPAVAVGIVLAIIGVGAAAFAIYLVVNPVGDTKQVPPFAFSGYPMASARAPGSLVAVPPDAEPPASADGGPSPAPLPSLVPSPHPHHPH